MTTTASVDQRNARALERRAAAEARVAEHLRARAEAKRQWLREETEEHRVMCAGCFIEVTADGTCGDPQNSTCDKTGR